LTTRANTENAEFRRSGLLPPRDTGLQRRERQMFLYLFLGMLLLFAALLAVILASRI
jgi:Tfp pilus assembly protein PilN